MPDNNDDLKEFNVVVRGGCSKVLKPPVNIIRAKDITEACAQVHSKYGPEFVAVAPGKNTVQATR